MKSLAQSYERADDGFGLVEIVVSMFLLAILSLSLLPLLLNGVKQTANNVTVATATQLVNQQMGLAQSSRPTCAAMGNPELNRTDLSTDSRGVQLSRKTEVLHLENCLGAAVTAPKTVNVSVVVRRVSSGAILAQATTIVYVNG